MASFLQRRGPDRQTTKQVDAVGMIHTLLQTTEEAAHEVQPWSSDGETWIVADARIDARSELIAKLASGSESVAHDTPDCELILRAYHKWGCDCLQHLLGDFAFVIAKPATRSLFVARDPIGVKPIFYYQSADRLLVSSELDCVRMHACVSNQLDDRFVADFLLFGTSILPSATAFADIRRLPAGVAFTWKDGSFHSWRYWSPEVPSPLRMRRLEEYEEAFVEVLERALADRLRTSKIGVSFSGGLDSTSIAALAMKRNKAHPLDLKGVTAVFDRLMPDRERYFSSLAAAKLRMPLDFVVADDIPIFDDVWDSIPSQTPEPTQRRYHVQSELNRLLGEHSRIVLSGNGGDEAVRPASQYYQRLIKESRWLRLGIDCAKHLCALKEFPPIGLRTALYKKYQKKWQQKILPPPQFPAWLNPDFVQKQDLKARWQEIYNQREGSSREPRGKAVMENGMVAGSVCWSVPLGFKYPLEYRYPYFDVRVINYCWSLPAVPLRFDKQIIRRSMKELLPREVLRRPKQGLAAEVLLCKPFRFPMSWRDFVARTPEVEQYVVGSPPVSSDEASRSPTDVWRDTCPYELASWMHNRWKCS